MNKSAKVLIFLLVVGGVLYLLLHSKEAYKLLTQNSSEHNSLADWKKFVPHSEKFEVFLPSTPQYMKEAEPLPHTDKKRFYEMYVSEKLDGTLFLISVMTYPIDLEVSPSSQTLQDVTYELVKTNPNNHLVNIKPNIYQSYEAIDFAVENPPGEAEFKVLGKAFIVNNTIYMLTYTAHKDNFDQQEYDYFVNSFIFQSTNHKI
jgi:hypothetical protein